MLNDKRKISAVASWAKRQHSIRASVFVASLFLAGTIGVSGTIYGHHLLELTASSASPKVPTVYRSASVVPVASTPASSLLVQPAGDNFGYGTPFLYVERSLDNTSNLTQTSTWGNPVQSPVVSIVDNIGENNKTNPMALSLQTESNTPSPFGVRSNYSAISSFASLSQSYLDIGHAGVHRDIVGGNIVVAQGGAGATAGGNVTGLEIDMINQFVPISAELSNNVAILLQSAGGNTKGQAIYSGTAISITGQAGASTGATGNGWHDGVVAYGSFDRWSNYVWNALNAPAANGIHVGTTRAAADSTIAEFGLGEYNAADYVAFLKITGDGIVSIGSPIAVINANGKLNAMKGLNEPLSTPLSKSACQAGDRSADINFIYVCTAKDHWRRAALSDY